MVVNEDASMEKLLVSGVTCDKNQARITLKKVPDQPGVAAFYTLIEDLRRETGCAVLLVSHDLHVVMGSTDRVLCINNHVCCSGAPESVQRHPEYVALFGPDAARRLAVYSHAHDHAHDLAGNVVPAEDRPLTGQAKDRPHDACTHP